MLFCAVVFQRMISKYFKSRCVHADDYLTQSVKAVSRRQSRQLSCFRGRKNISKECLIISIADIGRRVVLHSRAKDIFFLYDTFVSLLKKCGSYITHNAT